MPSLPALVIPAAPNQPVNLGARKGRFRIGKTVATEVTVSLTVRMLPRPRVVLEGGLENSPFSISRDLGDLSDADFTFGGSRAKTPIVIASASEGDTFDFSAWPHRETIDHGRRQPVGSINGAILNFYAAYEALGSVATRKILFGNNEWEIALRPQPGGSGMPDQLANEGGYGVTHIFEIKPTDAEPISAKAAGEILKALTSFLSFARGANCGVGLLRGSTAANVVVWEQWGFSETSRWSSTTNWFSSPQGQFLRSLFPGFMRAWQSESREYIESAVEMYAEANRDEPHVKPSLMLAQSALELLSWLSMVQGGCLSPDGFRNLSAADHIRLLLHQCQISSDIPLGLAALAKAATGQKQDGPAVLTEIRNSLVHPGKPRKHLTAPVYSEAWRLSMWYLELAMLNRFGYEGSYVNRVLRQPAIQPVPWQSR